METTYQFDAQIRPECGTSSARTLRNNNRVPAVLYGADQEPIHFSIEEKEIQRCYLKGGFFGKLVTLNLDGKAIYSVAKDIQKHPVNDRILHVDFTLVEAGKEMRALVPVRYLNSERCVGIRRGGTLNVVKFAVELYCMPENIPESLSVNLQAMNIGESVHISDIDLPEGARTVIKRDFTLAAIAGRVSRAARDAEAGEGTEEEAEAA